MEPITWLSDDAQFVLVMRYFVQNCYISITIYRKNCYISTYLHLNLLLSLSTFAKTCVFIITVAIFVFVAIHVRQLWPSSWQRVHCVLPGMYQGGSFFDTIALLLSPQLCCHCYMSVDCGQALDIANILFSTGSYLAPQYCRSDNLLCGWRSWLRLRSLTFEFLQLSSVSYFPNLSTFVVRETVIMLTLLNWLMMVCVDDVSSGFLSSNAENVSESVSGRIVESESVCVFSNTVWL